MNKTTKDNKFCPAKDWAWLNTVHTLYTLSKKSNTNLGVGELPGNLGGGAWPASGNPYPISDQNM